MLDDADFDRPDVRADLVEQSTDLLSDMLDDIVVVMPTDEKGQAIVPAWEADYRIAARATATATPRCCDRARTGRSPRRPSNNVPITERLETFAGDNEMPSCAPPRGSVL